MRFPADEIHLVRLGEKTRLTIPHEGRCPFKVGHYYVLERELDISEERDCLRCNRTGYLKNGQKHIACGGHGTRIHYVTKAERIESAERVLVLDIAKLRPEDLSDAQALEEGWESAEEWREAFYATHGETGRVWSLKIEITTDIPQFVARQNGLLHPPQYVSTADPTRAVDDCEAPTAAEYREWAEKSEAEQRRQREAQRIEDRGRALIEQAEQMRKKAA